MMMLGLRGASSGTCSGLTDAVCSVGGTARRIQFCTLADSGYAAFYSFAWSAGMFHGFVVDPNAYQVATETQFASLAYAQMVSVSPWHSCVGLLRARVGPRWLQYIGIVVGLSGCCCRLSLDSLPISRHQRAAIPLAAWDIGVGAARTAHRRSHVTAFKGVGRSDLPGRLPVAGRAVARLRFVTALATWIVGSIEFPCVGRSPPNVASDRGNARGRPARGYPRRRRPGALFTARSRSSVPIPPSYWWC